MASNPKMATPPQHGRKGEPPYKIDARLRKGRNLRFFLVLRKQVARWPCCRYSLPLSQA